MSKALPTDDKTERLLNLVLALLGTKKFVKKSELLEQIPGYEGSAESKERMFERDKDELRRIGIPIETSQLDPLFEDEIGYRIPKEKFQSTIAPLNSAESTIASVALKLVSHIGLTGRVQEILMRLDAPLNRDDSILSRIISVDSMVRMPLIALLPALIESIRNQSSISFEYRREQDGTKSSRRAKPIQLGMKNEEWLITAWDYDRSAKRTFFVDQISNIQILDDSSLVVPNDLSGEVESNESLHISLRVPWKSVPSFELEGGLITTATESHDEDGVVMDFEVFNLERFLRTALSITPNFTVVDPGIAVTEVESLRSRLRNAI